jgi:hypothetical protein
MSQTEFIDGGGAHAVLSYTAHLMETCERCVHYYERYMRELGYSYREIEATTTEMKKEQQSGAQSHNPDPDEPFQYLSPVAVSVSDPKQKNMFDWIVADSRQSGGEEEGEAASSLLEEQSVHANPFVSIRDSALAKLARGTASTKVCFSFACPFFVFVVVSHFPFSLSLFVVCASRGIFCFPTTTQTIKEKPFSRSTTTTATAAGSPRQQGPLVGERRSERHV